jgi:hypothetical protein
MATISLHLYETDSVRPSDLREPTLSRIPCLGEYVMASGGKQDWFLVKLVVLYEVPEDDIEADVYAVKVDHHEVLRAQGFLE